MTKPLEHQNRGISARLLDQPYLMLILAPMFWGGNVVAAKMVVGEMDPFLLLASRCVGATLFILPFAWRFLHDDMPVLRRNWPLLMAYGAVGYAIFNGFLYIGLTTTTAVNSSIEQGSLPMLILAANFIIFRVRATLLQIIGVLIAITGVALTATHGDLSRILTLDVNVGDGFIILACLTYTSYTLALRFRPKVHIMSFMAVAFAGAAITALVMLQVFGSGLGAFATVPQASPKVWAVMAYVMVFPSMFSQVFYARGVELVGANRAAPSHNLIPVFGTLGSVIILGERLEVYHYIAAAIIIGGIAMAEWAARRMRA
ncbi:DMT family transporter [Devosia neptuniae]|jgi:drug/metabolite transporter (DMT)-like permease|uniref:DMT family transporter n=1 Tax=Devosia TaxID=46913 RepID=UPI0022AFE5A0|nr:DMT family transporter [Devosia neptuniae]MCZ4346638.1 DMT family transporter [Devosia neptuniae]|tara:strand:+ start:8084 stop:9031 length:948 start_codon:yes stop_codon:yes gene_type:complete